jgi:UDP-N-acetyl-D-glucosamine dehydrogenase
MKILIKKIRNKTLNIGVIGMGYVGLPLAILIAKKNYTVFGFDQDKKKINKLKKNISYINHISVKDISKVTKEKKLLPTCNFNLLSEMDIIIICVPTPLTKNKVPDLKHINNAVQKIIEKKKNKDQLIILESTTYPGTSNELLNTIFKKNELTDGFNFFMSYSPEREDPGNKKFKTINIPKVIGADNKFSKKLIKEFYSRIFNKVVEVDSLAIAEATKIYENIFRSINIALVNEMKFAFSKIGIDIWKVIKASSTKPFGFMPFYPGPGLGGHCIPIDPIYFSWQLNRYNFDCKFIKLAEKINSNVPLKIVNKIKSLRNNHQLKKILIVGLAYKKNIDDYRESPSLFIMNKLLQNKFSVDYHDKFIKEIGQNRSYPNLKNKKNINISPNILKKYDLILLLTDHDYLNYNMIQKNSKLIIDTRNSFSNSKNQKDIIKM